jgi:hypothetical protein
MSQPSFILVEARGVEPLSETTSTRASTGVSLNLAFLTRIPQGQGLRYRILKILLQLKATTAKVPAFNLPSPKA